MVSNHEPLRRDVLKTLNAALDLAGDHDATYWTRDYYNDLLKENKTIYNTYLYNEGPKSAMKVEEVKAEFAEDAPTLNGFEILNKYFDEAFANNPKLLAFGEDFRTHWGCEPGLQWSAIKIW